VRAFNSGVVAVLVVLPIARASARQLASGFKRGPRARGAYEVSIEFSSRCITAIP
jgi:hypothetical protein